MSNTVDWARLESELERMVNKWEGATNDNLASHERDAFEYGFELGFRIASGEEIQ